MTDEQEEAVEKLTSNKKASIYEVIRIFKKEGIEKFVVTRKEYIETVLSMLKEKDEHIKELELEKINNAESICLAQNKMLSYFNGYEDGKNARGSAIQRIIDRQKDYIYERQIEKCKNIIDKKDRIIDEMAKAFKQDDVRTVEEIKQYFERKVEE